MGGGGGGDVMAVLQLGYQPVRPGHAWQPDQCPTLPTLTGPTSQAMPDTQEMWWPSLEKRGGGGGGGEGLANLQGENQPPILPSHTRQTMVDSQEMWWLKSGEGEERGGGGGGGEGGDCRGKFSLVPCRHQ